MIKKCIDTSKKSNIKCEHCRYWQGIDVGDHWGNYTNRMGCINSDSPKYDAVTNYWNRCKYFEWRADILRDRIMSKLDIVDGLRAVIINNSNIEADDNDIMVFTNVEDVNTNGVDTVRIQFGDRVVDIVVK